ncbi:ATP--guanido phosphotransferase [Lacrimispora sp. NSJ-141]|uniref:ATP--guanido phosphotransferase n=1 Tax=Lientehia hominis TaxID=2897778 RepID=A0AAP2RHL1_9FIRM|nr:ATP--guanido phosphotransferase [Lientehia hominis]MCD2491810.1 ATP--guanido phosphotransferase [Lientehia hominis]
MQMLKWYQETEDQHDVFLAGRIRLVRNLEHYPFPVKLTEEDGAELVEKLENGLKDIGSADKRIFHTIPLSAMGTEEKEALKERRAINGAGAEKRGPESLLLSEDETVSITLDGEDHIRLQCLSHKVDLNGLWNEASRLDDYINERFAYAFHEKYGYLTAYPTNVGTGLRAAVTLHLPMLSAGKQFGKLVSEMSRFGVSVQGLYGEGSENYGSLYEVSNQKTLGQTEEEIIALVQQMADRLAASERKVKSLTLRNHRLDLEDEIYKSYGVLRYAKKLSVKEAMTYLSQVRVGEMEGLLQLKKPLNFYGLMMEIQPTNIKLLAPENEKTDLKQARASYIRSMLPELV